MVNRQELIMKCTPAWVVAVDMGYGHQRAAHPLRCMAYGGKVINANNYKGIPKDDLKIWHNSEGFYNWISRFKSVPLIGEWVFGLFDKYQSIKPFYPMRDLSQPNFQVKSLYHYIDKGWGKDLINKLNTKDIPLITTFFGVAFMAEEHGFRNDIYAVATDTDISRSWVARSPNVSRIKYLCPNKRTLDRLKLYGVRSENLFMTGFPLPLENIGDDLEIIHHDIINRLPNLDPKGYYLDKYKHAIEEAFGVRNFSYPQKPDHPLTIMFAVGGAGAQKEIGVTIAKSLRNQIRDGKVHLILVAGIHNKLAAFFKKEINKLGLRSQIGEGVRILHAPSKEEYFDKLNLWIRKTDVLWTKPSELSFYCALGLPIIMAPPLGSQEVFNKTWLKTVGAGIAQENPEYTDQWLFEWLDSGFLAEAAMEGFIDAPKFGTYNVAKVISSHPEEMKKEMLVLQY